MMNDEIMDDPRKGAEFDSRFFPLCDGEPLPAQAASSLERQKLGLASSYYLVNIASSKLREFRDGGTTDLDSDTERILLQKVEEALLAKEAHEDQIALLGICATPTLQNGHVVDLEFSDPSAKRQRKVVVPQSSTLSVEFDFDFPWDKATDQS